MQCFDCGHGWDIGYSSFGRTGTCPECRSHSGVKPNVVFFGEPAPQYKTLNGTMSSLTASDVFLVTGTSGNVINIDDYLVGRSSYNIYNGLERPRWAMVYNKCLLQPATEAFQQIDKMLRERMRP
jgi:NAD-dependent deacetylase